jgi:hypothetical protein
MTRTFFNECTLKTALRKYRLFLILTVVIITVLAFHFKRYQQPSQKTVQTVQPIQPIDLLSTAPPLELAPSIRQLKSESDNAIAHLPNNGRMNYLINPQDYGTPNYGCEPIQKLIIYNPTDRRINDFWLSIEGDELSYRPSEAFQKIFLSPRSTNLDKTLKLFHYLTFLVYHQSPQTFLNANAFYGVKVYGYAWCSDFSWLFANLLENYGGFQTRDPYIDKHDALEVLIDGKWRFFDIDQRCWLTDNRYEPIGLLAFKRLQNKTIPLQFGMSSSGPEQAQKIYNINYTATEAQFSEGVAPLGLLNDHDIKLHLPAKHFLIYDYQDSAALAGGIRDVNETFTQQGGFAGRKPFVGNLKFSFDFKRFETLEQLNEVFNLNSEQFKWENGVLTAKTDASLEYAFDSDYPIVNIIHDIQGQGVEVSMAVNQGKPFKTVSGKPIAYGRLLKSELTVNHKRDAYPLIRNNTVHFYKLTVKMPKAGSLTKFQILTAIQFNKHLFPRLTSGLTSKLIFSYLGKEAPTTCVANPAFQGRPYCPIVNEKTSSLLYAIELAEQSRDFIKPKVKSIVVQDGLAEIQLNSFDGFQFVQWKAVDSEGLLIHPNLMGLTVAKQFQIKLLNPEIKGIYLTLRFFNADFSSGFSKPTPLTSCQFPDCADLEFNWNKIL